jgi:hypothetical protein
MNDKKKKYIWAVVCFHNAGAAHIVEYFSDVRIFSTEKKAQQWIEKVGNRLYDCCDLMQREVE